MNVEGQLYASVCAILHRVREHLCVLVSAGCGGVLEPRTSAKG